MSQTTSLSLTRQLLGIILWGGLQNSLLRLSRNPGLKRRKRGSQKLMRCRRMGMSKRKILMKSRKMKMEVLLNHLSRAPKDKNTRILLMTITGRTLLMITHLMLQIKIYSQKDRTVNILMKKRKIESKKMSITIMFRDNSKNLLRTTQWMKFHLKSKKFRMKKMI